MLHSNRIRVFSIFLSYLLLTACGGGSTGNSSNPSDGSDTTAPTVVKRFPLTDMPIKTQEFIRLEFSEPINPVGTNNIRIRPIDINGVYGPALIFNEEILVRSGKNKILEIRLANNGQTFLDNTVYVVEIDGIQDYNNNKMMKLCRWMFATEGATVPDGNTTLCDTPDPKDNLGKIEFAESSSSVNENIAGGLYIVRFKRTTGSTGKITINFKVDVAAPFDAAIEGVDYAIKTKGPLVFEGGSLKHHLEFIIMNDEMLEADEVFSVTIINPDPVGILGPNVTHTVMINNDEVPVPGSLAFNVASAVVDEAAGTVNITVNRTIGSDGEVSVDFNTSNGTALAGKDYSTASGTLLFPAGALSQTITIPILDDIILEPTKNFTVNLSNATGGVGVMLGALATFNVEITDDDKALNPGTLSFSGMSTTVLESIASGAVEIIVNRSVGSEGMVTVNYTTNNGTAIAGTDYTAQSGVLTFNAGVIQQKILVNITNDILIEPTKNFSLTLSNITGGATLGTNAVHTVLIEDDDTPANTGTFSFLLPKSIVDESVLGGKLNIIVQRTGGTNGIVTVNYAAMNGTAVSVSDFNLVSGVLSFANGITRQTITVDLVDDTDLAEGIENFSVKLSQPSGGAMLNNNKATHRVDIIDNDILKLGFGLKQIRFDWAGYPGIRTYSLWEINGKSPVYNKIATDLSATKYVIDLSVHHFDWVNSRYFVQICDINLVCVDSNTIETIDQAVNSIGYLKSSNSGLGQAGVGTPVGIGDRFGFSIALSDDANTLAIGAIFEDSQTVGVRQNIRLLSIDNSAVDSGAVYVFNRDLVTNTWQQQAFIKASNTGVGDQFGRSVALSADGNTLAVGALNESNSKTGVISAAPFPNPLNSDILKPNAGAVYVYSRTLNTWAQEAYIKASNTGSQHRFGKTLDISDDGKTLAVGADGEDNSQTGIKNLEVNFPIPTLVNILGKDTGAIYVFVLNVSNVWTQQSYIKASNAGSRNRFGRDLAISGTGDTIVAGAHLEDGNNTGVNTISTGISADSGAAYVFTRALGLWSQQALLKASNTGAKANFGYSVAISGDGTTLAVAAHQEENSLVGIRNINFPTPATSDIAKPASGAVYVFSQLVMAWTQQAYIKADNSQLGDEFGFAVALDGLGNTLAIGALYEDSSFTGLSLITDNLLNDSGAVYIISRVGKTWSHQHFVKAKYTNAGDLFGSRVVLDRTGNTMAVSASREDSSSTGINSIPNKFNKDVGAAFLY